MEALLGDDLPSEDSEDTAFDPDGEDAPDGAELLKEMEMVFGEEDDGEEDDGEFPGLYGSDEGDDGDGGDGGSDGSDDDDDDADGDSNYMPGDEKYLPFHWSAALGALLHGSLDGGDPRSRTGLLAGVAPMLLHRSTSPHPERPARMVAIYDELIRRGLAARAKLVPVRPAAAADLALVHTAELAAASTATYETDGEAKAALGIDSDTCADAQLLTRNSARKSPTRLSPSTFAGTSPPTPPAAPRGSRRAASSSSSRASPPASSTTRWPSCARPATTARRGRRWGSVCSTTCPSPPPSRGTASASSGC